MSPDWKVWMPPYDPEPTPIVLPKIYADCLKVKYFDVLKQATAFVMHTAYPPEGAR